MWCVWSRLYLAERVGQRQGVQNGQGARVAGACSGAATELKSVTVAYGSKMMISGPRKRDIAETGEAMICLRHIGQRGAAPLSSIWGSGQIPQQVLQNTWLRRC